MNKSALLKVDSCDYCEKGILRTFFKMVGL